MRAYRALEDDLRRVRAEAGRGSPREDSILAQMDRLWWDLTPAERETLDAEGPTCNPAQAPIEPGISISR